MNGRSTIYETLKAEIIEQDLLPKQQLIEEELAKRFDVSRTPIRQALQRLEVEGFVEIIPYRGTFVKRFSPDELKDLFQVRMALERLAAQLFCTLQNEKLLLQLEANLEQATIACEKGEKITYAKLDETFHDYIMIGSGNKETQSITEQLNQKTYKFRLRSFSLPEQMEKSLQEHKQIFHYLKARDEKKAADMAERHVKGVLEAFYAYLQWEQIINK